MSARSDPRYIVLDSDDSAGAGAMAIESKDDNVFRFVHLRGPGPRGDGDGDSGVEPIPPVRRRRAQAVEPLESPAALLARAVRAKRELESLVPGRHLIVPVDGSPAIAGLLAVSATGRRRLSRQTVALLGELDVRVVGTPVSTLLRVVDELIASARQRLAHAGQVRPGTQAPVPLVQSVGVAELLVVKQHITRYERTEIAHVENVLTGEEKVRTHRKLDRTEEETEWSSEQVTSQERELEATERFELNKETTSTVQKDQERGFGLTLSGRYGPTVEFSSELNAQSNTSQTTGSRQAVDYARDVVERSRDSITTTVREQRRRRVLREVEEVNEHTLANTGGTHVSGVYQFLDKIYTSQVFNYGLREMFDFLVPEPASYLQHLSVVPRTDVEEPVAPAPLDDLAADASAVDEGNYLELGARYGVEGLTPPPPAYVVRRGSVTHGSGETEAGRPHSFESLDIDIPDGYWALFAEVATVLTSDDVPTLIVSIGNRTVPLALADMTVVDLQQGSLKAYTHRRVITLGDERGDLLGDEKITMHVFANETANYTVKIKVHFWRADAMLPWRIATYDKVAEAHRNLQLQYRQALEELRARQEQATVTSPDYGSPPARNLKTINGELKKHCVAILRGTHDDQLATAHTTAGDAAQPPLFDIVDALDDGSTIRFLETAFEWDQLQYACYPYFWARTEHRATLFQQHHLDPVFEEFLRSGSARVVVPVRPGLEAAVAYFLKNKVPWSGQGEPTVEDPAYRPIVEEIQERAGAGQGEIPVGEPWETRVPTAAIALRADDQLPEWQLTVGTDWDWGPVP